MLRQPRIVPAAGELVSVVKALRQAERAPAIGSGPIELALDAAIDEAIRRSIDDALIDPAVPEVVDDTAAATARWDETTGRWT